MRKPLCLVAVVSLVAYPALSAEKKGVDPAAEIRAAMADPESVLVVIADLEPRPFVPRPGKMAVFPVSGIANVEGSRVTVKAGTFVIADMNELENPKKNADLLVKRWKSRQGDNMIAVREGGGLMGYTFFSGELKSDRTFDVSKVVRAGKPQ